MSAFLSDLVVKEVKDDSWSGPQVWELQSPLIYSSDIVNMVISVPAGFKTDFCSVPRIPIVFDAVGDLGNRAGTVHDFLYSRQMFDRLHCDSILKEALITCGVEEWKAQAMYLAVRAFGSSHFKP